MGIGAKLGGSGAPAVFLVSLSRFTEWVSNLLNKSRILLDKSRILILHPHFSGPFGANAYVLCMKYNVYIDLPSHSA